MDNQILPDNSHWFNTPFGRAKLMCVERTDIKIAGAGAGYEWWSELNSDTGLEGSLTGKFISDHLSIMDKKKEEFLKEKLINKGFGHLIAGMEKKRFPKICCVKN